MSDAIEGVVCVCGNVLPKWLAFVMLLLLLHNDDRFSFQLDVFLK